MERVLFSMVAKDVGPKQVTWEWGGSIGESLPLEKRDELMRAFMTIMQPQFAEWDREATKFN